jgi:HAD superfamily hydrolase (TIGR01509 family)
MTTADPAEPTRSPWSTATLPPAPRAVVFDCDGLLVDTEPCWTAAERELFARHGTVFTLEHKAQIIGRSPAGAGQAMARLLDLPGAGPALADELLSLVHDRITHGVRPRPGATHLVSQVAGRFPVAVASNSPRHLLDAALAAAGFDHALPVRIGVDEVPSPKPAPDLYLAACALLAMDPLECLALEDSPVGLQAARAAGLHTVGVPSLPGLALAADLVVPSLGDSLLLEWVQLW